MRCHHDYAQITGNEGVFSVDVSSIVFGRGAIVELGAHARSLGCRRVALFTDPTLARLPHLAAAESSLRSAGLDLVVYAEVAVEPTDASFLAAAKFARDGSFDGYVSLGGGSVIDTCKAAILYAAYPADFLAYVNKPLGEGRAVPGPLPPHIACPTTCGTGSECTGIAVFDLVAEKAKTGIVSRRLRPTLALVDPAFTATLPASVVAASGFDVLSHALESFTARPFTRRGAQPGIFAPSLRPLSQGANPWSDLGSREALRLGGKYLLRAVRDAADVEAREGLAWAATLAGIAFGNAGVHLPHAMSYAVSGRVRDFHMPDYPGEEPLVPHGVSVIVNAPSVFRFTAAASPERHLSAAEDLGVDVRGAGPADAGELVASGLLRMMRDADIPNGLTGVGYADTDLQDLARTAALQTRLTQSSPRAVSEEVLRELFRGALRYW